MFKYFVYKLGQFIVNHTSLQAVYKIAIFFSDLHYYCSFRDRRAVKNNLRAIVPPGANIPRLAKEVFRNFGKYLVEFFHMARCLDRSYIDTTVRIINREHLDGALKEGKGAIALTVHMGNWELGGLVLGVLGYPIVVIALPHKERPVNDLFNDQRTAQGVTVVPTNTAVRKCIEALRGNKVVALVADRHFGASGEVVDFLGKKVCLPRGPAMLSLKTGAPIIPAFILRTQDDRFTFTFEQPICPPASGSEHERFRVVMNACVEVMERHIRAHPTQWMMFREFWVR